MRGEGWDGGETAASTFTPTPTPTLPPQRGRGSLAVALLSCWYASVGHADQYRSEVREAAPTGPAKSSEQLLKESQGNPYAQALILQQQAQEAAAKEDYAAAIQKFEQALGQKSLSPIAEGGMRYDLAQLYLAKGEFAKAAGALNQWLQTADKPTAEAYAALAAAYVGMKKPREALAPLNKALASTQAPKQEWMQVLFSIYYQLGDLDQGVKVLEQQLRQFPPEKDTWLQLVALHQKLKQPRKAAGAMALAYKQGFLTAPEELLQLAKLYAAADQPYEAGALLEQWLTDKRIAQNAQNYELLAATWMRARERERALAAMQRAVQQTGRADQYLEIAQLQMEMERWPQATDALMSAFNRGLPQSDRGKAYLALGFAQYQQKDLDAAGRSFTAAATQTGSEKAARAWLAFIDAGITASGRRSTLSDAGPLDAAPTATTIARIPDAQFPSAGAGFAQGGEGVALEDGLTPIGAVAAGSADGRIPPWTGGLTPQNAPAGVALNDKMIDPFPEDQPLFVIDQSNYTQYSEQLSLGHQALLKRYASYKLPIYRTRRSAAYPQAIYDATVANQKTVKLVDPDILQGATLGMPFRVPQTGNEVLWNHRVHYRGESIETPAAQAVVNAKGEYQLSKVEVEVYFIYGNLKAPGEIRKGNLLLYYVGRVVAPPGVAGLTFLVHETTDLTRGRALWAGPPGMHKLFRLPSTIGYDYKLPDSEGMKFVDQINMYNGGFNRYTWKLIGRRPYYAPYNSYRTNDPKHKYTDLLKPRHYNQDNTRYELHRMWVVEAVTRPEQKHEFKRRVFYVDEDSWVILMVDCYDQKDQLWRFQEGHGINMYKVPMTTTAPEMLYDFRDTRYLASFLTNEETPVVFNQAKAGNFTPSRVTARHIR